MNLGLNKIMVRLLSNPGDFPGDFLWNQPNPLAFNQPLSCSLLVFDSVGFLRARLGNLTKSSCHCCIMTKHVYESVTVGFKFTPKYRQVLPKGCLMPKAVSSTSTPGRHMHFYSQQSFLYQIACPADLIPFSWAA